MSITEIMEMLANLVIVFGLPIAIFQYLRAERNHRTNYVMHALELVGTEEQRKARSIVFAAKDSGKKIEELSPDELNAFESVSFTLDRVGMYCHHDRDFRKIALSNHWDLFIRCWNSSEEWLNARRKIMGPKHYCFYKEIVDAAKKQHPESKALVAISS